MIRNSGAFSLLGMSKSRACTFGAVLLIWLCCSSLLVAAQEGITDPVEVKALQDIRNSLIDINKNLSNWRRGDPCTSNWTGVLCFNTTKEDAYLHVRELQLLNMNLSGTLSPSLGLLSYMEILDFMWNSITGSIPPEIGNIKSLVLLLLNGNQLTGPLPEELGHLPKLDRIQIDQNHISGPIPKSFAYLNSTKHFHMNNNSISGQIPAELSRLPNLVHFLLDNNNLSGTLPPDLYKLPKLLILQLDNNQFDGSTIPPSYGNMTQLLKLSLRNCSLRGPMPDLSRIPNLGFLDLSFNQLAGPIPPNKLSENITTIDLSNNTLNGTIPAYFSDLPRLQLLSIANNSLSGSVPSTIWQTRTNGNEGLDLHFENNRLSNISGSTSLPQNVTLRLQGNPACSNSNIVRFCGSKNGDVNNQSSTESNVTCPAQSCPPPNEYFRTSPISCFCAAPLIIGYRLKSPGFTNFIPYRHGSEAKLAAATEKWGRNVFEYPQPTFQKLLKEQCMEPFFVFQVFCVGLWCLDEYWYYSLFTLFMLFMFESTMAKSRLKTLSELRRVRVDTQTIMVHRCGKWVKLSGTDLLPGDVVSIGRSSGQHGEDKSVPADMLLLAGSAILNEAILTGESTPQWKVSITGRGMEEKLSAKRDKNHVLFGGTKILQHTPDKNFPLRAPDGGCLAVVLRTGFETSQGKLMRTILFSTERVTANSWESGLFILFLVVFAVIAAGYVLKKGLEDPTRSKYKLFLSCSLIITSVIPPELPMELSIAVNTSLIALARRGIFCTEPFRIPFAGKVDICCFDKTGTLTSDDMEFRGVVGLTESADLESDMTKVPVRTAEILASCHALVFVDNKLVGDPLEKAALTGIDWSYKSDEKAMPKKGGGNAVQIVQRHHFASHLKRMAVVVRTQEEFLAFVKGAPETIQDRLIDLPPSYVDTYKKYTRQGSRVLALAFKYLPDMTVSEARSLDRDVVETGLAFAGFAVFNCPIREDSASVLSELKNSSHDLVMITGDQALTACHVASQVHIISKPALILGPSRSGEGYEWISPDEMEKISYGDKGAEELSETHDLCIGGDCIDMLQQSSAVLQVIPYVKVFARVAPEQKELILTTFKTVGRVTLMCGDGTNDVGALKQAHVGVALLNAVPPTKSGNSSSETPKDGNLKPSKSKKSKPEVSNLNGESSSRGKAVTKSDSSNQTAGNRHQTAAEMQRQRLKKLMEEMNEEGDGRSAPIVKLGDASMASPFTAKHASVAPTTDIIRQGRSTLVTTLQMFKILGLNCLATAYVLSVMYLDGVKLGDVQATISGVFTAAFFLFISQARPLPTLSAERPHPHVFCFYVFLSLMGQFAIHLFFLMSSVKSAEKYMPDECIEPDSDFHPNLVNTVSYMVSMMLQLATFAVNYIGHPFNQSITESKPFLYAILAAAGFFTVITSDLFRNLNDWLKLVPLPPELRNKLLIWALLMFLSCYTWEKLLRWAFPGRIPSWKKRQRLAAANLEKKKRV